MRQFFSFCIKTYFLVSVHQNKNNIGQMLDLTFNIRLTVLKNGVFESV